MKKTWKRILASLLAMAMLLVMLPVGALADVAAPGYPIAPTASGDALTVEGNVTYLDYNSDVSQYVFSYSTPVNVSNFKDPTSSATDTITGTVKQSIIVDYRLTLGNADLPLPASLAAIFDKTVSVTRGDATTTATVTLTFRNGVTMGDLQAIPDADLKPLFTLDVSLPQSSFDALGTLRGKVKVEGDTHIVSGTGENQLVSNVMYDQSSNYSLARMRAKVTFTGLDGIQLKYPAVTGDDWASDKAWIINNNYVEFPTTDQSTTAVQKVVWYLEDPATGNLLEIPVGALSTQVAVPDAHYVAKLYFQVIFQPGDHGDIDGAIPSQPLITWVEKDSKPNPIPSVTPDDGWTRKPSDWTDPQKNPVDPSAVPITGPTTYIAAYTPTVSFYALANGAFQEADKQSPYTASLKIGTAIDKTAPTPLPDAGYRFTQWTKGSETGTKTDNIAAEIVSGPQSYYAHFSPNVTFVAEEGGSLTGSQVKDPSTYVYQGENGDNLGSVVPSTKANTGYRFTGWTDAAGKPVTDFTTLRVDGPTTYTAHFQPTITFVAGENGSFGTVTSPHVYDATKGDPIPKAEIPTPTPADGYAFLGWTDPTGKPVDPATLTVNPVTGPNTYTANFGPIVTFVANDNGTLTGVGVTTPTYLYSAAPGQTLEDVVPGVQADTNYYFAGWTDEDDVEITDFSQETVSGPVTYYASFEPIITFVVYDDDADTTNNGGILTGTGVTDPQRYLFQAINGTTLRGAEPDTTADADYYFAGWTDEAGNAVTNFSRRTVDGPATYYAHFEPIITFEANSNGTLGGDVTQDTYNAKKGNTIPKGEVPVPEANDGYYFSGWTNEAGRVIPDLSKEPVTGPATYTANFAPIITFVPGDNGTFEGSKNLVPYEATDGTLIPADVIPTPTPDTQYYFVVWTDEDGDPVSDLTAMSVNGPTTYTANFGPIVTFVPGSNGTFEGSKDLVGYNATEGQTIPPDEIPTPTPDRNYYFAGWTDQNENPVTDLTTDPVTGPAVYTANFEPIVTFVPGDNGSFSGSDDPVSYEMTTGDTVPTDKVPGPTPDEGYYFKGWVDPDGNPVEDPSTVPVDEPTTYTATFEPIVTFQPGDNGTFSGSDNPVTYDALTGDPVPSDEIPGPTPDEGYYFKGWVGPDGNPVEDPSKVPVDQPITYTAVFEPTVIFNPGDNGTFQGSDDPVEYDATTGKPVPKDDVPTPTPDDGYTFKGWVGPDGTPVEDPSTVPITEHTTFTAVFDPIVTFKPTPGGTLDGSDQPQTYDATTGKPVPATEIPSPTPDDGYYFSGWTTPDGKPVEDPSKPVVTEPVTYEAHFNPIVTFQPGEGGTIPGPTTVPGTTGETIPQDSIPQPVPNDGYIFDGWYTPDGKPVDPGTVPVDGPTTYVAHFNPVHMYTLTFQSNGGTLVASKTVPAGTVVSLTDASVIPSKDNYTFTGWHTDADLKNLVGTVTINSDMTVYAGWDANTDWLNDEDHVAYIIGYPDNTVRPTRPITRAEAATIFFRLLTDQARADAWTTSNDYSDVSTANWFNNAVSTLSSLGVISGYPDGTFRPNNPITRAEFAAIACRFANDKNSYAGKNHFTDISNHWAAGSINKAVELGWISGYPDGTFHPNDNITRAEVCTLVNRMLKRDTVGEDGLLTGMSVWNDNPPSSWSYVAMQEATNSHNYTKADDVETWTEVLEAPNWADLEKSWSNAGNVSGGNLSGN